MYFKFFQDYINKTGKVKDVLCKKEIDIQSHLFSEELGFVIQVPINVAEEVIDKFQVKEKTKPDGKLDVSFDDISISEGMEGIVAADYTGETNTAGKALEAGKNPEYMYKRLQTMNEEQKNYRDSKKKKK